MSAAVLLAPSGLVCSLPGLCPQGPRCYTFYSFSSRTKCYFHLLPRKEVFLRCMEIHAEYSSSRSRRKRACSLLTVFSYSCYRFVVCSVSKFLLPKDICWDYRDVPQQRGCVGTSELQWGRMSLRELTFWAQECWGWGAPGKMPCGWGQQGCIQPAGRCCSKATNPSAP